MWAQVWVFANASDCGFSLRILFVYLQNWTSFSLFIIVYTKDRRVLIGSQSLNGEVILTGGSIQLGGEVVLLRHPFPILRQQMKTQRSKTRSQTLSVRLGIGKIMKCGAVRRSRFREYLVLVKQHLIAGMRLLREFTFSAVASSTRLLRLSQIFVLFFFIAHEYHAQTSKSKRCLHWSNILILRDFKRRRQPPPGSSGEVCPEWMRLSACAFAQNLYN